MKENNLNKPDINSYPLDNIVIIKSKWMLVLINIVANILEFFHSSKNNKLFTIVEGNNLNKPDRYEDLLSK